MSLTHINPAGMHQSPFFSQAVLTTGPGRLLVIGGQNGVDATGQVVGPGLAEQTAQALRNLLTILSEVGATQEDVVRLGIYLVAGQDVNEGFAASAEVWGRNRRRSRSCRSPISASPEPSSRSRRSPLSPRSPDIGRVGHYGGSPLFSDVGFRVASEWTY